MKSDTLKKAQPCSSVIQSQVDLQLYIAYAVKWMDLYVEELSILFSFYLFFSDLNSHVKFIIVLQFIQKYLWIFFTYFPNTGASYLHEYQTL